VVNETSKVDFRKESVFRDWLDETEKDRQEIFDSTIIGKINFLTDPSRTSTPTDEPYSRIPGAIPKVDVDPPIFACLKEQADQVKAVLWDSFVEMREFYFEAAALDSFSYPSLSMARFSDLCLRIGHGYMMPTVKP